MPTLDQIQQKLIENIDPPKLARWREALAYNLWAGHQSCYRLMLDTHLVEQMDDCLDREWRQ